ncbi:Peroxidase superfamily protein [Tripterygium wilfordii]|uniref:peroxidase n=1 Tax=Tripterygium wilfordii TaxID=458696 RepID=A0A7J7E108_TRIWF|nr:Peroxidase superfamily protein [Tripterygium wilfordii]
MGLCLALLFLILKLAIVAFAVNSSTSTLKEDCVDDIVGGVVLQFNIYQTSCPEAEDIIFSWSGGPGWEVQMGRRDSLSANKAAATNNIPAPNSTVPILLTKFQNVGLSLTDVVALSGAHTMGKARCAVFSSRLGGGGSGSGGGAEINLDFIQSLQQLCSEPDSSQSLAQLDLVTPATFDNQYFVNLLSGEGLLPSDQALVTDDDQTRNLVQMYAEDLSAFFEDFKNSMLRMGSLGVLTGNSGEIRRDCRTVN